VIAPAAIFSAISVEFETTDSRAAPNFVVPSTAAGAITGGRPECESLRAGVRGGALTCAP
jgi:hypothetical protein